MKFWIHLLVLGTSAISMAAVNVSEFSSATIKRKEAQLQQQAATATSRTADSLPALQKDVENSFNTLNNVGMTVQDFKQVTDKPVQNAYNQIQQAKAGKVPSTEILSVAEISKMTGISEDELAPFMSGHNVLKDGTVVGLDDAQEVLGKLNLTDGMITLNNGQKTDVRDVSSKRTVISQNNIQKSMLMAEVSEGNKTKEISKGVLRAATNFQKSQGVQTAAASMAKGDPSAQKKVSAGTISEASSAMMQLLKSASVDLALLERITKQASDETTTKALKERQQALTLWLAEWATAATNVGEGSNAISYQFFDRADPFKEAMKNAKGSLGGVSTINDTDRLVLFELTRSTSLSALQLGLSSSVILYEVEGQ